jgi:hypothetical protein
MRRFGFIQHLTKRARPRSRHSVQVL